MLDNHLKSHSVLFFQPLSLFDIYSGFPCYKFDCLWLIGDHAALDKKETFQLNNSENTQRATTEKCLKESCVFVNAGLGFFHPLNI